MSDIQPKCNNCDSMGWVCEEHPDIPWDGPKACNCGGAGMPCLVCNPCDENTAPRELAGSTIVFDKDGWRN